MELVSKVTKCIHNSAAANAEDNCTVEENSKQFIKRFTILFSMSVTGDDDLSQV